MNKLFSRKLQFYTNSSSLFDSQPDFKYRMLVEWLLKSGL